MGDSDYPISRKCLLEPIPEIWTAASLLREAVDAHLSGEYRRAETLIGKADIQAIAEWTNSIWGRRSKEIHHFRSVPNSPQTVPKETRAKSRMPSAELRLRLKDRDGFFCRFCGIPVVDSLVRKRIHAVYPDSLRWGRANTTQHAAFQCMWLQYDHVLPYTRGGDNSLDNLIITCAACNFGRMEWTIEEAGLIDPRISLTPSPWDAAPKWMGLEDFV